jgi:hypothetical protein
MFAPPHLMRRQHLLPTAVEYSSARGKSQAWISARDFTGTICATRSMTLLFWVIF